MVFLLTVQPMRGQPRHYPREAKILTFVAQALHANPCRLPSFARRLVIVVLDRHVNTMTAKRLTIIDPDHRASVMMTMGLEVVDTHHYILVIVVLDRHVNTMTAKRLAIIAPNHRAMTAKRLAIIALNRHGPDHCASVIIGKRLAVGEIKYACLFGQI